MLDTEWQRRVVVIIGAPRSGTTWIARELASQFAATYMEEPNWLWRRRNLRRKSDFLTEEDLTGDVISEIQKEFRANLESKQFLVEKTPANTIRRKFVTSILPHATYIVVSRSFVDIEESIRRKIVDGEDRNFSELDQSYFGQYLRTLRLAARYTPVQEYAFVLRELGTRIFEKIVNRFILAPRSPELQSLIKSSGAREATSRQIQYLRKGMADWINFADGHENLLVVRYETLSAAPDGFRQLKKFVQDRVSANE